MRARSPLTGVAYDLQCPAWLAPVVVVALAVEVVAALAVLLVIGVRRVWGAADRHL